MGNDLITKVLCKSCEEELPKNHSGLCPTCGEENIKVGTQITEKLTFSDSYGSVVERPGYRKPIQVDEFKRKISGESKRSVEEYFGINRIKQRKRHKVYEKKANGGKILCHDEDAEFPKIRCPKCGCREIFREEISTDKIKYTCEKCEEVFGTWNK